jgi:hypothetical protein
MLRLAPWLVLIVGAVAMFLGFAMDPLWPAQDPTLEMRVRYAEEVLAAESVYRLGAGILALGVVWLGLGWAWRRARR